MRALITTDKLNLTFFNFLKHVPTAKTIPFLSMLFISTST